METEVISMTAKLFGLDSPIGTTSAGGTESIILALYAYRAWGRDKGIVTPNMSFFFIIV